MHRRRTGTLTPRVLSHMEEAGASAYQWYSNELLAHVDPSGVRCRVARAVHVAVLLAVVVGAAWAAPGRWWSVAVAVVGGIGLLRARFSQLPWPTTVVIGACLLSPFVFTAAPLVAALGLLALHAWLPYRLHSHADVTLIAVLAAGLLSDPPQWRVWATIVGGLVLAALVARVIERGPLPSLIPRGGLGAPPLDARIPPPPTRIPWLVAQLPKTKRALARLEGKDTSASAEMTSAEVKAIRRKQVGGAAERKTALILLGLKPFRGSRIVHDVDLPGADRANIDHVVMTNAGVFVLDSKKYGTSPFRDRNGRMVTGDPGEVRWESGRLVHATKGQTRVLTHSVSNIVWACQRTSQTLGVPVTGVMVVHGADVQPGLTLCPEGVPIYVVCAEKLLSLLENGDSCFAGWQGRRRRIAVREWGMRRGLRSSTLRRSPVLVRPLGLRGLPRIPWRQGMQQGTPAPEPPRTPSVVRPAPGPALAQPAPSVIPLEQDVRDRLARRWEQMLASEPEPLDDVEPGLRGLWRGTPFEVLNVSGDDMTSTRYVAMTGPCHGVEGAYVWACGPEQYQVFCDKKDPVSLVTVPLAQIMTTGEGVID